MTAGRHLTVAELNNRPHAISVNTNTRVLVGDRVFLVATKHTAPGVAYGEPECTVVHAKSGEPDVTVRLDDGTEVTTHGQNIRHRRPERAEREAKVRVLPGRIRHVAPEHGEQLDLLGGGVA